MRRRLPLLALSFLLSAAALSGAEPANDTTVVAAPANDAAAARARFLVALFPEAPASDADFAATLKAAREAGVPSERLLEAEVFRILVHHAKTGAAAALADRLAAAAPAWKSGEGTFVRDAAHAAALSHVLRAVGHRRAGEVEKFRAEGAEAVLLDPDLSDLVAEIDNDARREALLATPVFSALAKAVAARDEVLVKKAFAPAYWAEPPLSCSLAADKLSELRAAREAAKEEKKSESPKKP